MTPSNSPPPSLSPHRIATLADGVFAIAMTFLVLDVKDAVVEAADNVPLLWALLPKLGSYILGFVILGLFWNGHHIASHYTERTDRIHLWLNIHFLIWTALVPFPAELLGERYSEPLSVLVYGINLSLAAIALYAVWWYATQNRRLVSKNLPEQTVRALKVRLLLAVGSYVVAVGFAFLHPFAGIAVFVASHLYFVVRPVNKAESPRRTGQKNSSR